MKEINKKVINTERLILKRFEKSDKEALVNLLKNEIISKTFMIPDYKTDEEYQNLADKLISFSQIEDKKHLEYGIYLDGKLIGFLNDCGFDDNEIEVGYVIDPIYHNKGYATESFKAIIKYLKEEGFKKVTAGYFIENEASHRVMEKCGMHLTDKHEEIEYRGIVHKCNICQIEL